MRVFTLKKFQNDEKIQSLSFDTFQEISDFIWGELKCLEVFNFSCSSEEEGSNMVTYYKLKDENITYEIRNKKFASKKNMLMIGEA